MTTFFVALLLFGLGFVVHIAIWRVHRPRATGQMLIAVMTASICGGALALWALTHLVSSIRSATPADLGDWAQAVITALALAAAYVMTYPAIEVESPTLVMIEIIAAAGPRGVTSDELYRRLGDDVLVLPRIEDLLLEGLAKDTGPRIALTPKGLRLAQVFSVWRRLLGAGIGG